MWDNVCTLKQSFEKKTSDRNQVSFVSFLSVYVSYWHRTFTYTMVTSCNVRHSLIVTTSPLHPAVRVAFPIQFKKRLWIVHSATTGIQNRIHATDDVWLLTSLVYMADAIVDYDYSCRDCRHALGKSVQMGTVLTARDIRPHWPRYFASFARVFCTKPSAWICGGRQKRRACFCSVKVRWFSNWEGGHTHKYTHTYTNTQIHTHTHRTHINTHRTHINSHTHTHNAHKYTHKYT
jgi:hypothetical protein